MVDIRVSEDAGADLVGAVGLVARNVLDAALSPFAVEHLPHRLTHQQTAMTGTFGLARGEVADTDGETAAKRRARFPGIAPDSVGGHDRSGLVEHRPGHAECLEQRREGMGRFGDARGHGFLPDDRRSSVRGIVFLQYGPPSHRRTLEFSLHFRVHNTHVVRFGIPP